MRQEELNVEAKEREANFSTESLGSGLGVSIRGLKFRGSLAHETLDRIFDLLRERQVLYFHEQDIRLENLPEIARLFGKPEVHPIWPSVQGCPEVLRIAKLPGEEDPLGSKPMTCTSFFEAPSKFLFLYCENEEGPSDYLFTSLTKAYDGLSKRMQDFLGDLKAVHSPEAEFGPGNRKNDYFQGQASSSLTYSDAIFEHREHPLVHVHPETGRKSLYLNETFTQSIVGLKKAEGAHLLKFLFAHCARPEFGCRVPIRSKSLVICDNRATTQTITPAALGQARVLYAMTIENEGKMKNSRDTRSPTGLLI